MALGGLHAGVPHHRDRLKFSKLSDWNDNDYVFNLNINNDVISTTVQPT